MKRIFNFSILCLLIFLGGCAQITEFSKVLWGSSTKALEEARTDAISKTYDCSFDDCFEAVLSLGRNEEALEPVNEKFYDVFIKNRSKRHIIVVGIEGNVDTTEVGIFFSTLNYKAVKIEIASLSSSAKRRVAEAVFEELNNKYSEAESK